METITLLQVLPEIAGKSQVRFASNFQSMLSGGSQIEISDTIYLVHCITESGFIDWSIKRRLSEAFEAVAKYGKDCQVLQVLVNGDVVKMFN